MELRRPLNRSVGRLLMTMLSSLLILVFVCSCVGQTLASPGHASPTSPFDRYGRISWENEKARLDNFAIQLMMRPELIGYFLVRVGKLSCRGEAQAHALRAKHYLMNVRHIPWNSVMWRDTGFAEDFQVTIWLAPRGVNVAFDYDRPTDQNKIRNCRHRRVSSRRAPNQALELTAR